MNICSLEKLVEISNIIKEYFAIEGTGSIVAAPEGVEETPEARRKRELGNYQQLEDYIGMSVEGLKTPPKMSQLIEPSSVSDSNAIIRTTLEWYGVPTGPLLAIANARAVPKSNVVDIVSSYEIDDMFHGIPTAKLYFDGYVDRTINVRYWLGGKTDINYVSSNEEVSKNFQGLKNDIFMELQEFLKEKGELPKDRQTLPIFNDDYLIRNYEHYQEIMSLAAHYFFKSKRFNMLKSYTDKSIPNIVADTYLDDNVLKAYSNLILLANFDSILSKKFGNLVDINNNEFNNLQGNLNHDKYKIKVSPDSLLYWSNGTHGEESVETANFKLAEMLVNSMPAYNNRNEKTSFYLEMKDFYLLAAFISDYELLHGNAEKIKDPEFQYLSKEPGKQLQWYLDSIIASFGVDKTSTSTLFNKFKPVANIIYSIQNFLQDPELNISVKEANSKISIKTLLGQVLNNSFGATYHVYEKNKGLTIQRMYSQDFNSTGLQNSTFSHMKDNFKTPNMYDLSADGALDELNKLFKGLADDYSMLEALSNSSSFQTNIIRYISRKSGMKLNKITLAHAVTDMEITNNREKVTVAKFRAELNSLMVAMNSDFKSDPFQTAAAEATDSLVRFDSTIKELIPQTILSPLYRALSEGFLSEHPIKSVMNIKTKSGEAIPSFKTASLTYKDTELFDNHRNYKKNQKNSFSSELIKEEPIILGTSTKLEIVHNQKNKRADKMIAIESAMSDFNYDFLRNLVLPGEKGAYKFFNIIIGNYSDKSSIVSKSINADWAGNDKIPYVKGKLSVLQEKVRTQGMAFYKDTVENVVSDYRELFKAYNKAIGEEVLVIDAWATDDSGVDGANMDVISEQLNAILRKYKISDIIKTADRPDIRIMEELHYTKYGKNMYINQYLFDTFKIFRDVDKFKTYVKKQEDSFITKHNARSQSFEGHQNTGLLHDMKDEHYAALGIDQTTLVDKYAISDADGNLHPALQKWLWMNALARNEYLYISTKGEYMHPHKNGTEKRGATSHFNDSHWDSYMKEQEGRLVSMSKRNVVNTSTYEAPVRDSLLGIPLKLNMAAIEDFQTSPYSINGEKKYNFENDSVDGKMDAHDGSSFLDAVYSKMVDASYPGRGYSGTKKQFGTIITDHGVIVKKDAESELNNKRIRNSSNSTIPLINMKKKMLSMSTNDLKLNYTEKFNKEFYLYDVGVKKEIKEVTINPGKLDPADPLSPMNSVTIKYHYQNASGAWVNDYKTIGFNNLFDLWVAFGAEDSIDSDGEFSEGSNDILYKVVTGSTSTEVINTTDSVVKQVEKHGALKSKIIHILSNKSALKAGATNLNNRNTWTDLSPLAYATFESRFMGPQLDASHTADDSEIKEITQIISALAQNGYTADWAREAYSDIQEIIKDSSKEYLSHLESFKSGDGQFYKYLSNRFMESVVRSDGNNIAKSLINALEKDGINIPFSNQNFYSAFVKDVITRMNTDFISRKYPGMGAILSASEGIIQLYDIWVPKKVDGVEIEGEGQIITVTQEELRKEAYDNYNLVDLANTLLAKPESNADIIEAYIKRILPNTDIILDDIEIGDIIEVEGQEYKLFTPEQYYRFKDRFENNDALVFQKVRNKPRDLKPTLHKYTYNGRNYNVFDYQSVKFRYHLSNLKDPTYTSKMSIADSTTLNNLIVYVTKRYANMDNINLSNIFLNPTALAKVNQFLNNWTQRNLSLLQNNLTTSRVHGLTDFNEYFANDDLMTDTLEDVIEFYRDNEVSSVEFRAAELVTNDIYQSKFKRDDKDSMYKIQKEGYKFFSDRIKPYFAEDTTSADLKVISSKHDKPIYIRFEEELQISDGTIILHEDQNKDLKKDPTYARKNTNGETVYNIPTSRDVSVRTVNGKEIISIRWSRYSEGNRLKSDYFNDLVNNFLNSFGSDLEAVVPLMRSMDTYKVLKETSEQKKARKVFDRLSPAEKDTILKERAEAAAIRQLELDAMTPEDRALAIEADKKDTERFNINEFSYNKFKKYMDVDYDIPYKKGSIFKLAPETADAIGKKMYASWEKSHELVAARIPAQSMQSFMPMRNVAYNLGGRNDAYVSVSQLWLQGSDLDIDKAYLLGNSFSGRGYYSAWSELSSFSTKAQIDALTELPKPTQIATIITTDPKVNKPIDGKFIELYNNIVASGIDSSSKEFSVNTIKAFNKMLRYLNTVKLVNGEITRNIHVGERASSEFLTYETLMTILDRHNLPPKKKGSKDALKNKVVAKIHQIISAPANQVIANSPITVDNWHESVKTVVDRKKAQVVIYDYTQTLYNNFSSLANIGSVSDFAKFLEQAYPGRKVQQIPGKDQIGVLNEGQTMAELAALIDSSTGVVETETPKLNLIEIKAMPAGLSKEEKLAYKEWKASAQAHNKLEKANAKDSAVNEKNIAKQVKNLELFDSATLLEDFQNYVKNRSEFATETPMSSYDMMSYYIMQQNAAVGKEDVGIAANGIKAFFALSDYFNNFYKSTSKEYEFIPTSPDGLSPEDITNRNMMNKELMSRPELFSKKFEFNIPFREKMTFDFNAISDLQIDKTSKEIVKRINPSFEARYENAALILSSLLSAATDNAKELLMAKINATPKLASMHIYLAVLGLSIDQIVEIMTSDVATDIVKRLEHNLFVDENETGIDNIFKELNIKYGAEKQAGNLENLAVFKDLYFSSKELSSLSGLLGINQKRKANTFEVFNYLNRFETVFNNRNSGIFETTKFEDKVNFTPDDLEKIVDKIVKNGSIVPEDVILSTVMKASAVKATITNFDGVQEERTINLITEGFDFRLYISNPEYKQVVKEYYNLIKYTFNIFDIMDNVPHFSEMVNSLILTHNVLLNSSEKYSFVYGHLKDVINIGSTLDSKFNPEFNNEARLARGANFIDMLVIENWLENSIKAKNINLNIKDLMKMAGKDTYDIYVNEKAKDTPTTIGNDPNMITVKADDDTNPIITLETAHGRAQFKRAMEELILPILQEKAPSELVTSFKIETTTNTFGRKGSAIVSSYALQELRNPVAVHQYHKLVGLFDHIDRDGRVLGAFKSKTGSAMKIKDLFFMYNLLTNNEKYGNKRITPLLENYMKEETSLGYDYIKHYSAVDAKTGQKGNKLLNIFKDKYGEEWKDRLTDNIFFHINNDKGVAEITRTTKKRYAVTNPHFTVITDVGESTPRFVVYQDIKEIIDLMREKGFLVRLECI